MNRYVLIFLMFFNILNAKTIIVDRNAICFPGMGCFGGCKSGDRTYKTIQDGLDHASNRDTIEICKGKYNEYLTITVRNITLKGIDTQKIDDVIINSGNKNGITISNRNITLKNFKLKSLKKGIYANWNGNGRHSFDKLIIEASDTGIEISRGSRQLFNDLNITSTNGYGIHLSYNTQGRHVFKDLNITSKETAIYSEYGGKVFQNLILKSDKRGIDFDNSNTNVVMDNISIDSKDISIHAGYAVKGNHILTNLNLVSQKDGIYFERGFSKLENSKINAKEKGIVLVPDRELSISNIELNTTNGIGIQLNSSSSPQDINISDVNIYAGDDAIYTNNSSYILIDNIVVKKGKRGIYLPWNMKNITLQNSMIMNTTDWGLYLDADTSTPANIKNNCFYGNKEIKANGWDSSHSHNFDANYYDGVDDINGDGKITSDDSTKLEGYIEDSNFKTECNHSNYNGAIPFVEYRMDECEWDGSNNDVKDNSGNSYDGTSKNGANTESNTTIDGMIGRVGDLRDGNYSVLANINLPSMYTITMWIKFPLDETNHEDFSGKKYFNIADLKGSNNDYIYFKKDNGNWGLCVFGSTYECKSYNPQNLTGWHFVTFKVSGSSTKFYVDNNLKLTFNQHPTNVILNLLFNSDYGSSTDNIPNGQSIGAYIDEFKIFNGLVSSSDLNTIYNNELSRKNYDGTEREEVSCETYESCYIAHFSNQSEIDENWTIIKSQNYTPQVVNQKLRLTTNSANIATGLTLKNKVFKANGTKFKIKFKHYAYDGSSTKGADGIAIVFSDSSIEPVAGAFGGSLGYAQRTSPNNEDGFAGGWIGIGLDEYGNYSNPTEGRVGGPGFTEQAVAIRGSYLENYKYLAGTSTLNPPISNGDSSTPAPGYTYEVRVDTTQTNRTIISVYSNRGSGREILINKYEYNSTNTPDYFKFSLTGSTGGENNIHEIDDLEIWALDCNSTFVSPHQNYLFDIKEINRNDKNITTKIVNKAFSLEIFSDKNFTGTVCSTIIDSYENNISAWIKNYFNDVNSSADTSEGNPNYMVSKADKNSSVKIVWLENQNVNCPLMNETNHTLSADNFAIRPKEFDITNYPSEIKAGEEFNITFKALDENGNLSKDYNETDSFSINVVENKTGCITGNLELNISFVNGEANTSAKYSEMGDINITIKDNNFANVDLDDTSIVDRIIKEKTIELNSSVYKAKTITSFGDDIIYDDKNLSHYAEVNTTIKMLNKDNNILQNFDEDCYANDVNISYETSDNIIDSFKGIYNINGVDKNDSKFESWDNNFTVLKEMFKKGEANNSIKFNIYKNRAYPVSIVDLNFSKTNLYFGDINSIENVNKHFAFYYLRIYGEDIYTTDINSSTLVHVLVYDRNKNHFNDEILLNWFVYNTYNIDNVKLLGYTTSYNYDSNISDGFEVNITKINSDFNISVYNPNEDIFSVIHLQTPEYLWYSRYKDYNDSLSSTCSSHYCIEYNYVNKSNQTKEVGSGEFKGSESNITTPKQKRFGIKIYR